MPKYRITTRHEIDVGTFIGSSTTVDSLDEAQSRVWRMLVDAHGTIGRQVPSDQHHAYVAATRWDANGGTIGPLPDGTVIEVRPA
jgi:hypothetical protein